MDSSDPSSARPDCSMAIVDDQTQASPGGAQQLSAVHPEPDPAAERPQDATPSHGPSSIVTPLRNLLRKVIGSPPSPSAASSSDTSDESELSDLSDLSDLEGDHDMSDILRSLRIKGYSPEESRWSTKFHTADSPVFSLRVVTWNVDFMAPNTAGRVSCILDHLKKVVLSDAPKPSCVLLQELDQASFREILANDWVRKHYAITPPNTRRWPASYGVATLVSRHAHIRNAQMLQFRHTGMGRTAVFVDVEMSVPGSTGERRTVRIANTHLESLPDGERSRPIQLCGIADLLCDKEATGGGLVGGDMNMIGPADQNIHVLAGLQDACDDSSAVTWGFQPPSRFPPGRLDRIFYVGDELVVGEVRVIGKGLKTKNGSWASDHYGLVTTIQLAPPAQNPCSVCSRT